MFLILLCLQAKPECIGTACSLSRYLTPKGKENMEIQIL